ncbi:protein phosphatase 2C [Coccomyxa subellipsoidea C-169]|uniref:protein-serine/threonine phosphatase n=1 Tax=Coccomyxa subellipsoidea (strain C-169) TaxID=574566 RepID=I0YIS0_COCSC|nr:protein phosphatase 2C [Coccomyxa subellipsoidea C-169]EIE18289.1 protein phosphatase 2C [Coccomyxa subellipsoidea C-169]|eukprot:XP_005642833.1 protein phosphatase 2C [Coccomyxa subellipsoidea C-169]
MGAYLSQPITDKETFIGGKAGFLEYGGSSMQGWRRTMEDAHIATVDLGNAPDAAIFGVFDGHGGSEVAKFCQKYLAEEITRLEKYHEGNLPDSLVEVFHKMDSMLKDSAYGAELEALRRSTHDAQPQPDDSQVSTSEALDMLRQVLPTSSCSPPPRLLSMFNSPLPARCIRVRCVQAGCTAVVAVLKGQELWVANAGDSRAVLCRGGQALALSEDHKPQSEGERNRITAAGGFVSDVGGVSRVNGNLNLSRAIGDLKYKGNDQLAPAEQIITAQPDIVKIELRHEDRFFVLACDGVWDVMSNQEVVQFVSVCLDRGMALPDIASQLLDACLAPDPRETRGIGCDNMTACIVVLNRDAPAAVLPKLAPADGNFAQAPMAQPASPAAARAATPTLEASKA